MHLMIYFIENIIRQVFCCQPGLY